MGSVGPRPRDILSEAEFSGRTAGGWRLACRRRLRPGGRGIVAGGEPVPVAGDSCAGERRLRFGRPSAPHRRVTPSGKKCWAVWWRSWSLRPPPRRCRVPLVLPKDTETECPGPTHTQGRRAFRGRGVEKRGRLAGLRPANGTAGTASRPEQRA
ncbi:uncharacterized protein Tco025E_08917 [Trypanosoma conorhini]|uniref:Uncharacterized protein n=1 Tax=Trypanosoma conorhini TaxID=83891 RepID=A0A3R7RCZ9_9TRYP|nr:uncharacterized protein Tco025E_08917 [Trypanosoma conorhini]RNF00028.1 hypothetical protein Tco025E_08917 [Trypanosoma conorhini]